MSGSVNFLLDTNVISATAPDRRVVPDPAKAAARSWIASNGDRLYLPAVSLAEIAVGIGQREAAGATRYAALLGRWLRTVLATYPDRVLDLDAVAALHARALSRRAREARLAPGFADLAIACIARAHDLTVATRNVRHFGQLGVPTVNPFDLLDGTAKH